MSISDGTRPISSAWNRARFRCADPRDVSGSADRSNDARLIVWKGFCSVHERFTVEQIAKSRTEHPGCRVVVHPECRREVVMAADSAGSTEFIVDEIESAPVGTTIAVGTEVRTW